MDTLKYNRGRSIYRSLIQNKTKLFVIGSSSTLKLARAAFERCEDVHLPGYSRLSFFANQIAADALNLN